MYGRQNTGFTLLVTVLTALVVGYAVGSNYSLTPRQTTPLTRPR